MDTIMAFKRSNTYGKARDFGHSRLLPSTKVNNSHVPIGMPTFLLFAFPGDAAENWFVRASGWIVD